MPIREPRPICDDIPWVLKISLTVAAAVAVAVTLCTAAAAAPDGDGSTAPTVPSMAQPLTATQNLMPTPIQAPGDTADTPQLSISVDNGKTSVVAGDTLDYTLTLQNIGIADVAGLRITQTMPSGMDFGSADLGGTFQDEQVVWDVDLAKGATAAFHTSATVGAPPAQLLRLATVACAQVSAHSAAPIVCASHSDQLPAGAAADAELASIASARTQEADNHLWWYAGVVMVIAGVASAAFLFIRRLRT